MRVIVMTNQIVIQRRNKYTIAELPIDLAGGVIIDLDDFIALLEDIDPDIQIIQEDTYGEES